jgi:site-specific recombinase XerD
MKQDLVRVTNTGTVALRRPLTPAQFGDFADFPPELEWLANLTNPKTRWAYKIDVSEFSAFAGLGGPAELRTVTRAHVIAWHKDLESRGLSPAGIRRKRSALSSLFDYLCERNAVSGNPVDGVKRQMANGNEGSTPGARRCAGAEAARGAARRYAQGRARPRILATLFYHGLRREELCGLRVRDIQSRQGVMHFRGQGQARQDPLHAGACHGPASYRGIPGARRPRR